MIAAVVGARIGELHASALNRIPDTEVRWICDLDSERATRLASEHGIPRVTSDYEQVLADPDVMLVSLAIPHFLHFEFARQALARGKHVAIEKPLAVTTAEARELVDLGSRSSRRVGVIFQNRFASETHEFLQAIRSEIGDPLLCHVSVKWMRAADYYNTSPWRSKLATAGGGVVTTQALHFLDLARLAIGMPERLFTTTATLFHDIEVEDTCLVIAKLSSGAVLNLVATVACFPEEPAFLQVVGTRGSVCLAESRGALSFAISTREAPQPPPLFAAAEQLSAVPDQDEVAPVLVNDELHRRFFAAFISSIENGGADRDEFDGLETLRLTEAIYRSARERREVSV